jgi:hypothetical protein
MADYFLVFFRSGSCDLDDAARAMADRGLTVSRRADDLIAGYPGSPEFRVVVATGDHVKIEAAESGEGTPHQAAMAECDIRFEVFFDDLAEVLDEINTFIEVETALQEASRGFIFLPWNGHLSGPDD